MTRRFAALGWIGIVILLVVGPLPTASAQGVSDEAIAATIDRIQDHIWSTQNPDGSFGDGHHNPEDRNYGGTSILNTYALLVSGVGPEDPRMARALAYLQSIELNGTYAVGIRAHIWAALPLEQYGGDLTRDAYWLLEAHDGGRFGYTQTPPRGATDHSTTQYGLLGLWEVAKRGGDVPRQMWLDAAQHFLEHQNADGGWSYRTGRGQSRGSMTAAGMTVLYVVLQEVYRDARQPPQEIMDAIDRGIAWFDQNFTADRNPNGNHKYYYLYGVERIGIAGGLKSFNGEDWFLAGAREILRQENGGRVGGFEDTAFALAFLARGRFPVWINKIRIADTRWNQFPNDIFFLSRYLSGLREHELNWQVVDLSLPAEQWLSAPIAWLSMGDDFELTDEQVDNLRAYLDLGGLLIADPLGSSSGFRSAMQELAGQLYPGLAFEPVPADHPIYQGLVTARPDRQLQHLSNGVRSLIVRRRAIGARLFRPTATRGGRPSGSSSRTFMRMPRGAAGC
jgi:hypothetical protein